MFNSDSSIIALDVGGRRIGVAVANAVARIARPLTTLEHTDSIGAQIATLLADNDAAMLVIGLPRNLEGDATQQTRIIESFVIELKQSVELPIFMQDEAVTSRKAEEELQARGRQYQKGDIDALAATYILEDFLQDHPEVKA